MTAMVGTEEGKRVSEEFSRKMRILKKLQRKEEDQHGPDKEQ